MRKVLAGLLLAMLASLGVGVNVAGATPTNPGYNMACDAGTDHCTGWTTTSVANIYNFHEWSHTFDPTGAGVWNTTALQWYVCNGPGCGDSSHPIGWVLHALGYDWLVPHMLKQAFSNNGTLIFEGHGIAQTGNVLRWSPCSFPTNETYNVSGAPTSSTNGYFNCLADGGWHNGGGWEWLNSSWVTFSTSANLYAPNDHYFRDIFSM